MNRLILSFCAAAACVAAQAGNVAYQSATTRFTVIADGVVRMEWQPDGVFTDAPSLLVVNREYPETKYTVDETTSTVTITTPRMVVKYKKNFGPFTASNLVIRSARKMKPSFEWSPGDKPKGNLKGTTRTLDGLEGDVQTQTWVQDMKLGERRELDDGLLATDGWTFIDDSDNYLFDDGGTDGVPWVKEREGAPGQDWYFMAYGHDYKAALRDFTLIAGSIPLPPRYAFGYWWSRYWAYSDSELRRLVDKFDAYDIPLDVVVVDMDWHYTDPGRGGWTGWTWNRSLFPSPEAFFDHMHSRGIKTTLNLHPADGVAPYEEPHAAIAAQLGLPDSSHIAWIGSDKARMKAMFDAMLHPMERQGVDFWWLDWQQHLKDSVLTGLDNTWWINHCFFTDMERQGRRRPLLYHRWGGLGNHRYQVGFSGDAVISWESLAYQPYFTSTASNVLYGYWSHDIGGHLPKHKGDPIDPEMYVRWLQFGAYSPIMRTHSSKDPALNKEPWVFGDEWRDIIRATVRRRYAMVPYIYSMAAKATKTGISLCRPLYYEWPEAPEAYEYRNEYMFGDNMLIAPVTVPAGDGGYAEMDVWLPDGEWYEEATGTLLQGGVHKRRFAPSEYGVYVKSGSILPGYGPEVNRLDANPERLVLTVYPAGDDRHGEFDIYEDMGDTPAGDPRHATVNVETHKYSVYPHNGKKKMVINIPPTYIPYEGAPEKRSYTLRVLATRPPQEVILREDAAGVHNRKRDIPLAWRYDGKELAVEVDLNDLDASSLTQVLLTFEEPFLETDGTIGRMRRAADAIEYIKYHGFDTHGDELAAMGTVAEALAANPGATIRRLDAFDATWNDLPAVLARQGMPDSVATTFLRRIDYAPVPAKDRAPRP